MIIVTTNDIPGYQVTAVMGEVMGVTVRSRNIGAQFTAGLRSLAGGELPEMTRNLLESRGEVMNRLVGEAEARGANAILAARFDASSMGDTWTEICAYGTAVQVRPIPGGQPGATPQSSEHAQQLSAQRPPLV
jgi:uncharacterized protein YbjQ (UPF0145 family)